MRSTTYIFDNGFKTGLRRFKNLPRNSQAATELYNLAPEEEGLELHEPIISLDSLTAEWGGVGAHWQDDILTEDVLEGDIL